MNFILPTFIFLMLLLGSVLLHGQREIFIKRRMLHASEILPPDKHKEVLPLIRTPHSLKTHIVAHIHRYLPKRDPEAHEIAQSIIQESQKYHWDPVFLMAVIETESAFKVLASGSKGELGLMQLRPSTAQWIAQKSGITWKGSKALENPQYNIQLGAAYLHELRQRFGNDSRLYLSGYNMGSQKLKRFLKKNTVPALYYKKVKNNYVSFYENSKLGI